MYNKIKIGCYMNDCENITEIPDKTYKERCIWSTCKLDLIIITYENKCFYYKKKCLHEWLNEGCDPENGSETFYCKLCGKAETVYMI